MGSVDEEIATAYAEMEDSMENESVDASKRFKMLLKKYQDLSVEYYNQDLQTKRTFALLIQKNQELTDELKRVEYENKVLKEKITNMMMRIDAMDCVPGDIRCLGVRSKKYIPHNKPQQEVKW